MEDFVVRVIKERDDLSEKIAKAQKYLEDHEIWTSDEMRQAMMLLEQQVLLMRAYENILQLRIDLATKDEEFDDAS